MPRPRKASILVARKKGTAMTRMDGPPGRARKAAWRSAGSYQIFVNPNTSLFKAGTSSVSTPLCHRQVRGFSPYQSALLPPTWREAISALMKEFRVNAGRTQEELGYRSGYDPVYIDMLERGRRNPSIRALVDICQAFGVRPSAFMAEIERRLQLDGNTNGVNPWRESLRVACAQRRAFGWRSQSAFRQRAHSEPGRDRCVHP